MDVTDSIKRETGRAIRALLRSPGFTIIVLVTLALGIGATTAIFTMLDHVVLHPLSYPEADRLVWIDSPTPALKPASKPWGLSVAEFFYFKKNAHTLADLGTYASSKVTVVGKSSADRVPAARVSASLFNVLRLRPAIGRLFAPEDNLPHALPTVVIAYDYWQQHLNGDPKVVGSMLNIDARSVQVIGVVQQGATIPDPQSPQVDLWLPQELDPSAQAENYHFLQVVGRLAPGATVESVGAELERFTQQLPDLFPTAYSKQFFEETGFRTEVTTLRARVIGDIGKRLWILLGAVALVLVIACANVANLFLVRAEGRQHEAAIRTALGARRSHFAWQYLAESMLLCIVGGVGALVLAFIGIHAVIVLAPPQLPRLDDVSLGWESVVFTCVIAIVAGIAFGFLTLTNAAQPAQDSIALREGGRGLTLSRRQQFVRGTLVAAQTALALVLLAAAGLMLQSFRNLRNVSPGFYSSGVLTAEVSLPDARYHTHEQVEAFYHELMTRAAALPGVKVAGAADRIPLDVDPTLLSGFSGCSTVRIENPPGVKGGGACVPTPIAAPGYFGALGIRLRGEEPSWSDVERRAGGVVVTKALAERLWPGQDPIGKGIKGGSRVPPFYRVVAVTQQDLRGTALDQPPTEAVFFPLLPIPGTYLWDPARTMTVLLHSTQPPEMLTTSLRRIVKDIDPNVPLTNVRTMDAVVAHSMARLSFTMTLLGLAAGMALFLSAVGLYGVISYIVARRTGEIGIRVALGARSLHIGKLVVWQSTRLALIGVVIGVIGALVATRVLRSVLFDVNPSDPLTLFSVSIIMLIIAALASYVPAQRAMRIDPVEALGAD